MIWWCIAFLSIIVYLSFLFVVKTISWYKLYINWKDWLWQLHSFPHSGELNGLAVLFCCNTWIYMSTVQAQKKKGIWNILIWTLSHYLLLVHHYMYISIMLRVHQMNPRLLKQQWEINDSLKEHNLYIWVNAINFSRLIWIQLRLIR